MRLVNRFEALGAPQKLIQLYKKEPFYFLEQRSDALSEPKEYTHLVKLTHWSQYEGEVDKLGRPSGKGIIIIEDDAIFYIGEGTFVNAQLTGLGRALFYKKDT